MSLWDLKEPHLCTSGSPRSGQGLLMSSPPSEHLLNNVNTSAGVRISQKNKKKQDLYRLVQNATNRLIWKRKKIQENRFFLLIDADQIIEEIINTGQLSGRFTAKNDK